MKKRKSKAKDVKLTLKDEIGLDAKTDIELEKVVQQLKTTIEEDIDPLYYSLRKAVIVTIIIAIIFVVICWIPYFWNPYFWNPEDNNYFIYDRIQYASIGILTFISIFYALVISPDGRKIVQSIEDKIENIEKNLIKTIEKKQKEIGENTKESKNKDERLNAINKANDVITDIRMIKTWVDVDLLLLLAVISLIIAIIFSMSNDINLSVIAYLLFSCGVGWSGAFVIEWRVLRIIADKYNLLKG